MWETQPKVDADSTIRRFLACESRGEVQGITEFSKTKRGFGDEVLVVLKRGFLKVGLMSPPSFYVSWPTLLRVFSGRSD
jgi:hypothetical protein